MATEQLSKPGRLGLPPLIDHHNFATLGEWIDSLYAQYLAIVAEAGITLWGKPLKRRGLVGPDGRDHKFWHLITDSPGAGEAGRRLSPRRAAVIGQVWYLLELLAAGDIRVIWWHEPWHSGSRRVLVTTVDFGLVVVLEEARGYFGLVTVYPVSRGKRSRTFWRAAKAWESGACIREDVKHPKWRGYSPGSRPPARQLAKLGQHT